MAKMIEVIALASMFGEGRKKIAGFGDKIKLPESDALRLKDLGLVKFEAENADDSGTKQKAAKGKKDKQQSGTGGDGSGGTGGDGSGGTGGDGSGGTGGDGSGGTE